MVTTLLDLPGQIPTPVPAQPCGPPPSEALSPSLVLPLAPSNRLAPLGRLLLLSDGLAGLAALLLMPLHGMLALPAVLLVGLALADSDLYRQRLRLSVLDDAPQLWLRGLAGPTLASVTYLLLGQSAPAHGVLEAGTAFVVLALLGRLVTYRFVLRRRCDGHGAPRALVVGAGPTGRQLAAALQASPRCGVQAAAFVDRTDLRALDGLPVLRLDVGQPCASLGAVVRETRADVIFVTSSSMDDESVVAALRECDRMQCEIFVVPSLHDLGMWGGQTEEVGGLPLLRLPRGAHRSVAWRGKRVFDIVFAGTALLLATPVLLLCALGAYLDGGPEVLFRQVRVGLDGRPFTLCKIRSLRPVDATESGTYWNVQHDPRLSTFGRLLRKSSLDELPQLWNVLRGDMSLVGPRPERPHFVERFSAELSHYSSRSRVPVGLTGWAQVNGLRGDTSISDRAHYDNQYIENWSLWLDVKIVLLTVAHVLRGSGA